MALRICPLCEATCGLDVTLQDGRAVKVRGDREDVFSQGFLCPKGARLHDLDADPDRLRAPLVRRDGALVETSWDEALARVAALLEPVWKAHGRDAVGLYLGNPNVHNLDASLWTRALIKAVRTKNLFTASTMDQMPRHVSSARMYGHPDSIPVPDLDRTRLLVVFGANPLESHGSLATAPDWPGRLRALQKRGGRLIVIDPVRTKTAELADVHLAIRPGADAFVLASLVNAVLRSGRAHPGPHLAGWQDLAAAVAPFSLDEASRRSGLPVGALEALVEDLLAADAAAAYTRLGVHAGPDGTLTSWLGDCLSAVCGHLDAPGGLMFPHTATHQSRPTRAWVMGRRHSRVRHLPEVRGELPVATLADELLEPGEGQLRALICIAGNPALSAPDAERIDRGLAGLDALVVVDPYLNETARHAHVVLPPPPPLQRPHYDLAFSNLAIRNLARFSPAVLPLDPALRPEWQILASLTAIASGYPPQTPPAMVDEVALGQLLSGLLADPTSALHGADPEELKREIGSTPGVERMLDLLLRAGPYGLTLQDLKDAPHGIDLGPLEPRLPDVLATPSGKVELAPEPFVHALSALARPRPGASLVLVGRRHVRSNNSWMHNVPKLVSGSDRCTLWVHPDDARQRDLVDGSRARVQSAIGAVEAPVEITDRVRRGVVSLPHGWGHGLPGTRMGVAAAHPGVNTNRLTDPAPVDPLSGNAVLNGIPVEIGPG